MRWLCILGLHKWTLWSDLELRLKTGRNLLVQKRVCDRCKRKEVIEIEISWQ